MSLSAKSPGFELNDIGGLSSADDIDLAANVHYRETVPTKDFHIYDFGISAESGWNFEGIRQYTTAGLSGKITWKSFVSTSLDVKYSARALSDNLTRGGPLSGNRFRLDIQRLGFEWCDFENKVECPGCIQL
jgi:hypothetical protein